jgi:hypothetical protein
MSFLYLENIKLQSKEFEQTKFITKFMYKDYNLFVTQSQHDYANIQNVHG